MGTVKLRILNEVFGAGDSLGRGTRSRNPKVIKGTCGYDRNKMTDWNGRWMEWIANNANASKQQIINQANSLAKEFGLPQIRIK